MHLPIKVHQSESSPKRIPFSPIQVQLIQTVVDGVNKLIEMEKKLEGGASLDDVYK